MRHFTLCEKHLDESPCVHGDNGKSFCVLTPAEFEKMDAGHLPAQLRTVFTDENATPVLDTHSNFSYGLINSVEIEGTEVVLEPIRFALTHDSFLIVTEQENPFSQRLLQNLSAQRIVQRYEEIAPATLLLFFLDEILQRNSEHIEAIEDNLEALEEKVLDDAQKSYSREIVAQRKLIMRFRHAIEPLIYILDELSDNDNRLFSSAQVKELRIQSRRASKMSDSAVLLRDYATQVREAFEAERDIKNNDIMKVFTIVTSIFLPLTLIAGWYGMNFRHMPELDWVFGYPMVIGLSAVVIVCMILFFKRKKWL